MSRIGTQPRTAARSLVFMAGLLVGAGGALHADTTEWRGKTLALAVYPPSKLEIVGTSAAFIVGATGGALEPGNAAGAKLQAESAIEDPASRVAKTLLQAAQQRYDVVSAPDVAVPRLANPKELARAAQGVDLLLDISSTSSVVKRPLSSRYWVNTHMTGRVIDVRAGKARNDSFCDMTFGGDPTPLTYDELTSNNAARLKTILARQADACIEKFKAKVLGIT